MRNLHLHLLLCSFIIQYLWLQKNAHYWSSIMQSGSGSRSFIWGHSYYFQSHEYMLYGKATIATRFMKICPQEKQTCSDIDILCNKVCINTKWISIYTCLIHPRCRHRQSVNKAAFCNEPITCRSSSTLNIYKNSIVVYKNSIVRSYQWYYPSVWKTLHGVWSKHHPINGRLEDKEAT